ncbi:hypothetical protein E2C01_011624 [Portunus trituberculatus]|uniref:Uncharacterized protein n=1 Tax=Portunus trituberculatus TaxID=210409 RepID=A0A5B7DBV0_PORTR|nr:hypothetical protein [Portunus trituberculatus]
MRDNTRCSEARSCVEWLSCIRVAVRSVTGDEKVASWAEQSATLPALVWGLRTATTDTGGEDTLVSLLSLKGASGGGVAAAGLTCCCSGGQNSQPMKIKPRSDGRESGSGEVRHVPPHSQPPRRETIRESSLVLAEPDTRTSPATIYTKAKPSFPTRRIPLFSRQHLFIAKITRNLEILVANDAIGLTVPPPSLRQTRHAMARDLTMPLRAPLPPC